MSVKKLRDYPLEGYWYFIFTGKLFKETYYVTITPDSTKKDKEDSTLRDVLIFDDEHYEVYQFNNEVDFSEFHDKMILVYKIRK